MTVTSFARVAVVGHVEWVDFVRVDRVPRQGEIARAKQFWAEAAGGGGVAAVQLARLNGSCTFFTALGEDDAGRRAAEQLAAEGVEAHIAWDPRPTRRGLTHLDDDGERTITIMGERHVPRGSDPLPWDTLGDFDAVYLTGGDAAAAAAARAARVLVATPRAFDALGELEVDVLVHSAGDADEVAWAAGLRARERVATEGGSGGSWSGGRWVAGPLPGPVADAFGCGDTFAAVLTWALGRGDAMPEALERAAAAGALCLTGHGPYGARLTLEAIERP